MYIYSHDLPQQANKMVRVKELSHSQKLVAKVQNKAGRNLCTWEERSEKRINVTKKYFERMRESNHTRSESKIFDILSADAKRAHR